MITLYFLFSVCTAILLLRYSAQSISSTALFVFWFVFVLLSMLDVNNFGELQCETTMIFITAPVVSSVGVFAGSRIKARNSRYVYDIRYIHRIYVILLLIVTIFMGHSLFLSFTDGIDNVRSSLQNNEEGGSLSYIFFTNQIGFLYNLIVPTLLLAALIASSTLESKQDKLYFVVSAIGLLFIDITFFSRIYLYMIGILFVITMLNNNLKVSKLKFLALISFLFLLLVSITIFRDPERDLYDIFKVYLIDYHTIGIRIFDYYVKNPNDFLGRSYYPLSTSYLGFPFEYIYRLLIDNSYIPYIYEFNQWNSLYREFVSYTGDLYYYNAFATNFFGFYYDFGFLGILFASLIYGVFLGVCNKQIASKHLKVFANFLLLYGFIGFFNPMYLTTQANMLAVFIAINLLNTKRV